ncbi:hypothetical protein N9176_01050 [bacterium]|nr:hypothetical protein [bacterium]
METKTTATFKTIELPKNTFVYVRNVGPYMGDTELLERLFNEVIVCLAPKNLLSPSSECPSMQHDDSESVPT